MISSAITDRTVALFALACATLSWLSACKKEAPEPYRRIPKEAGFVAFVGAGQDDPLWPILRASAERFHREQGLVEVRYAAPPRASAAEQFTLIRSVMEPSLRGLCIQVIDPALLAPILDQARQKGIQVVTMIRRVEYARVAGHVGYDEAAVGKALADETVRYLNKQGSIMVLHDGDGSRAISERYDAFNRAMKPMVGIERWAEAECNGDPVRARREISGLSARYPRLSAWVAMDPWPLMGWSVATAASTSPATASPLPPGLKLITCGCEPFIWPYVESGTCPVVVGFGYADAGLKALQFCQAATAAPGSGNREYAIPIRILKSSNLESYKRDWAVWSAPTGAAP